MNIKIILDFIKNKHEGQTRIQGTPYYLHSMEVANILADKGYDEVYQIVGLCHDLLEDTDTTYEEIQKLTTKEIADAVQLLTKEKGYDMTNYINNIKGNELAKMVKLADRLHNLREAHVASETFIQKYIKETKDWYVELAFNTPFSDDIKMVLSNLENR